jgi:vacuolar-type H+-ATPase subunit H
MLTIQSLKIAWIFVKKYAWIFFAILAGILAIVLLRRSPTDLVDQINAINKQHNEEIKKIRDAEEKRFRDREENQKRLEETLKLLDQRYKNAISDLDVQKRAEVDRILTEHKEDPDALAAELANVLGLQVQKP